MWLFALLACTKSPSAPATNDVPEVQAKSEEPAPVAVVDTPAWAGDWISPSCGERTFPRILMIKPGGTFDVEDLVSPCPPNATCVWSGIALGKGTWTADGNTATLAFEPSSGPPITPLPTSLGWQGAPAEGDCVYSPRD